MDFIKNISHLEKRIQKLTKLAEGRSLTKEQRAVLEKALTVQKLLATVTEKKTPKQLEKPMGIKLGGEWRTAAVKIKHKVGVGQHNDAEDVRIVQQLLNLRNYQVNVTGVFDDVTAQMVTKFIQDHPTPRGNRNLPYIEYNGSPAYNWRQLSGQWIRYNGELTAEAKYDTCLKTDVGRPANLPVPTLTEEKNTSSTATKAVEEKKQPEDKTTETTTPEKALPTPLVPTEMEDSTAVDRILETFLKMSVTRGDGSALWEREALPIPVPLLSYGIFATQLIFGAALEGEFNLARQGVGLKGTAKLGLKGYSKLEVATGFRGQVPKLGTVDWGLSIGAKGELALEASSSVAAEVQGKQVLLQYDSFTAGLSFGPSIYIDFPDLPALDEKPFLIAFASVLKAELDGTTVVYPLNGMSILELKMPALAVAYDTETWERRPVKVPDNIEFGFTDEFKQLLQRIQDILSRPINYIPNVSDMVLSKVEQVRDNVGNAAKDWLDRINGRQ